LVGHQHNLLSISCLCVFLLILNLAPKPDDDDDDDNNKSSNLVICKQKDLFQFNFEYGLTLLMTIIIIQCNILYYCIHTVTIPKWHSNWHFNVQIHEYRVQDTYQVVLNLISLITLIPKSWSIWRAWQTNPATLQYIISNTNDSVSSTTQ